ncbi:MAG: 2-C-methyl-D-erythritol 4-phosphate cytidylyltransferase [Bacteroidales bacterium]|nr:2-C-methyl-D-erythritol 4-phosphate cytidylyltransferase [Bacteroidales bacterium]
MGKRRYVIIMAAGSGTRMGGPLPKQFIEIRGKAILQHTIETFLQACPGISVVTVLNSDYIEYWRSYCLRRNFTCPQMIVSGGFTRFHSVRNALDKIPEGAVVAVHDGVRPLVSSGLVREMFEKAETVPALIPVVPCVDTLKVLQKDGEKLETVEGAVADRSMLYAAQTPQIFHSDTIKAAYSLAYDTMFTDDASVVQKYGKSLSYTIGERLNIKITTQEDLLLAEAVMSLRIKG